MGQKYLIEIERWLTKTGIKESRLGLLAGANPRAVQRIREGSARLDTLEAVLRYIRANPARTKRGNPNQRGDESH